MSLPEDELATVRAGLRRWDGTDLQAALTRFRQRREADSRVEAASLRVRGALVRWGPAQVAAALSEFRFRRAEQRRSQLPVLLAAGAGLLIVALALGFWRFRAGSSGALAAGDPAEPSAGARQAPHPGVSASEPSQLRLDDGSHVTLQDHESRARVTESSPQQVVVTLETGGATFRVPHRPERVFLVKVGEVLIEDIGTVFRVERSDRDVVVQVIEGKVRVRAGEAVEELGGGSRGSYALGRPAAEPAEAAVSTRQEVPKPTWQSVAQQGKYAGAFVMLEREGFDSVRDTPQDLLLAADVARLSGHPSQAVAPLRRLSERHAGDPRAPAAAFTLGSILLRDLKRPAEAAGAFVRAEQLAPGGNLAEDALARSAEAWLRAGDAARARAAVERYRGRYPSGRHLAFLERLLQTDRK
jgi:transmembrane sensor